MKEPRPFLESLARTRGELRPGFGLAALARGAGVLLGGIVLAGLSDYLVGWETTARQGIVAALLVGSVAAAYLAWRRRSRIPLVEIAVRSDASADDSRRTIRTAHDLAVESGPSAASTGEGLHAYLSGLAIRRAESRLAAQLPGKLISSEERRRVWRPVLWAGAAIVLLAALHPRAGATIAERFLHPGTELPPYSAFTFVLSSEGEESGDSRVTYGKNVTLAADISGPAFREDVEVLVRPVRGGGRVSRFPTYREGSSRHQRKIEGITEPIEFAFAIGRARSAWQTVELLYQPRLETAEVRITPPAYAKVNDAQFELGTEDLRGLRGSEVELTVSSNRPLSGGILTGRAPQGREVIRKIEAEETGYDPGLNPVAPGESSDHTVLFRWTIEADLVWTLDLVDIQGSRMEEPVLIAQRLIPDEKPRVDLVEPGPMVLATPRSAVDFAWEIEDDLGLERLDLLRGADKFRDRARPLDEGPGEKRLLLERTVVLSNLGVHPGQTLEFLIEARDRNPNLLGVGSSRPATVRVISEADYADRIRLRTTLEEFSARYRVLREALENAQATLEELAKAAASGDDALIESARQAAIRAHQEAADWFDAFARDFPAYATDRQLNDLSGQLRDELKKNLDQLEDTAAGWTDASSASEMAEALRKRLQPGAEQLAEQQGQAEKLAAIGGVMEAAAELGAIHEEQREISDHLSRLALELALGRDDNRGDVPALRARQDRNEKRLRNVMESLPERLARLPEGFDELKQGAETVLEQLGTLQVPKQMAESTRQAGEGKIPGASEAAGLALANLDQILARKKDPFCSLCQGGDPGGLGSMGGLAKEALSQMMDALRGRARSGNGETGTGGEMGIGGSGGGAKGGSGVTMQGIQLDIPLIGPPRIQLSRPPTGGGLRGRDAGPAGEPLTDSTDTETLPQGEAATESGQSWSPQQVPPRYRDAFRRFYSDDASDNSHSQP